MKIITDYVAWCWKAAELPAINNNGSISSVVSANPAAGFSIVSYTGENAAIPVGHGLSSAPEMVIIKNLDDTRKLDGLAFKICPQVLIYF